MTAWPSEVDELGIGLQAAIARHEQRSWLGRARSYWALLIAAVLLVAVLALGSFGAFQPGGNDRDQGSGGATTHVLPSAPLRAIGAHGGPAWGVKLAVTGSLACHGVRELLRGRARIGAAPARTFNARSAAVSPIPHCAFSSR
jgi:hypothetical protein